MTTEELISKVEAAEAENAEAIAEFKQFLIDNFSTDEYCFDEDAFDEFAEVLGIAFNWYKDKIVEG